MLLFRVTHIRQLALWTSVAPWACRSLSVPPGCFKALNFARVWSPFWCDEPPPTGEPKTTLWYTETTISVSFQWGLPWHSTKDRRSSNKRRWLLNISGNSAPGIFAFCVWFCSAFHQTHSLAHAKQTLYHYATLLALQFRFQATIFLGNKNCIRRKQETLW